MERVRECVSRFREMEREEAEIEIRLGTFSFGKFTAGVEKKVFHQLERDMLDSPTLTTDNKWTEVVDYHYMDKGGNPIRTRVEYNTENMELKKEHIMKRSQESVILSPSTEEEGEACRVARSVETPVTDPPQMCIPTHVRIKQRKVFLDVRNGKKVWSYEIAKTWSANNRSAVEHLQNISEPRYEVECELVDDDGEYMKRREDSNVSSSLLLKSKRLMGVDDSSKMEVLFSSLSRSSPQNGRRKAKKRG